MIRETTFAVSRRLYAVDMTLLRPVSDGHVVAHQYEVTAVWFRRKNRVTAACVGRLWDFQNPPPADVLEFLTRLTDGRYGGDCDGRWDGARYWGAQEPDVIEAHLELLRPMLVNFPAIPAPFDGWWRF
jgi:hypothetical protein